MEGYEKQDRISKEARLIKYWFAKFELIGKDASTVPRRTYEVIDDMAQETSQELKAYNKATVIVLQSLKPYLHQYMHDPRKHIWITKGHVTT